MFLENHHMDAAAADIHHKCGVGNICLLILNPFVQNQPWLVHSLISVKGFISVVDSHILCVQNHSGWSVHFCNFSARRATVSPCCRSAVVSNSLIVVLLIVLLVLLVLVVLLLVVVVDSLVPGQQPSQTL